MLRLDPSAGSWTETEEIDWLRENGRVTDAVTCPSRQLVDWNRRDWLIEGKWSCYSCCNLSLPLTRGLKQKRLIEGKWSCYKCCNLSPTAGSWTETEEIDRLKENGRVTVAATLPLPPACGLKQNRLIDWGKMAVIHMLQLDPSAGLGNRGWLIDGKCCVTDFAK